MRGQRLNLAVWVWTAACGVALVTTACDDDDAASPLSCEVAAELFTQVRSADPILASLASCSTVFDCSGWDPSVDCANGAHLGYCPREVASNENVAAAEQRGAELAVGVCARVEAGCSLIPRCGSRGIDCIEGRCMIVGGENIIEPPDDGSLPADAPIMCESFSMTNPSRVREATRSPDGMGFCCRPSMPSCDCGSFGGFVTDRCECGTARASRNGACDVAPPDWVPAKDEHGCSIYRVGYPTTACCNCRRDGGL